MGGSLLAAVACALPAAASSRAVLRLSPPADGGVSLPAAPDDAPASAAGERRGFDYEAFDSRLQALWFQRKAFLAAGRAADAARQGEILESFVRQEGIRRHGALAGALLAEARRDLEEGAHRKALDALALAATLDPGRSQTHFLRAAVLWRSGEGTGAAVGEWCRGLRALVTEGWWSLALLPELGVVLALALSGTLVLFGLAMAGRYQVPLRHEIEETVQRTRHERWAEAAGWAVFWLPAIVWVGAGWLAHYWILVTFRFMRRAERAAAVVLLLASACAVPCYRSAVALYGMASDPLVRTTLGASEGVYDPDRIVRLREIVNAYPQEPVYRFLLAGLYKNGRYFEEAFEQYQTVLDLAPSTWQAHVNLGNIYAEMGQHGEAIAQYRKALAIEPDSALAWFDLYVAQSESFRLREAEQSLERARRLDASAVAALMSGVDSRAGRLEVVDARIPAGAVWKASLEGTRLRDWLGGRSAPAALPSLLAHGSNALSVGSILTLCGCLCALVLTGRPPARRCLRCGRPFCWRCKSRREASDSCSQCVHLFVLGDGLAPETKTRKLYEVERHARLRRRLRRVVSVALPGVGQILAGRPGRGVLLTLLWTASALAARLPGVRLIERGVGAGHPAELLAPVQVPTAFSADPAMVLGLALAGIVWLTANLGVWRSREI